MVMWSWDTLAEVAADPGVSGGTSEDEVPEDGISELASSPGDAPAEAAGEPW